jgi:hypothetical protein
MRRILLQTPQDRGLSLALSCARFDLRLGGGHRTESRCRIVVRLFVVSSGPCQRDVARGIRSHRELLDDQYIEKVRRASRPLC